MSDQNMLNANPQAQMDAVARQQGFPDYATMQAYMRHRSESLRDSHTRAVPGPAAPPNQPKPDETGIFGGLLHAWRAAVGG